jgi:hypothetical protein
MKSNFTHNDDGTYHSRSTIDREPKMTDEETAQESFEFTAEDEAERLAAAPHERKIKVDLALKITPAGDKTVTIPVLCGEYPSTRVPELLALAMNGRRFKRILEAALDNPAPDVVQVNGKTGELL